MNLPSTFTYNGMLKTNEIAGEGNSFSTEFRQYDPRLGKWLSLDPLMEQFPWMSPFVGFDNNPILYVDPWGLNTIEKDSPAEGETKGGEGEEGESKGNSNKEADFTYKQGGEETYQDPHRNERFYQPDSGGKSDGDDSPSDGGSYENDDIIFKNKSGNEIGRIIEEGKDKIINVDTKFAPDESFVIDPKSYLSQYPDIDAVGFNISYSWSAGGGFQLGRQYVYFLDGPDKGNLAIYNSKAGNVGIDATLVSFDIFVSDFNWAAPYKFFNANGFSGNFNTLSGGGASTTWSNVKDTHDELYPGMRYQTTWTTYTVNAYSISSPYLSLIYSGGTSYLMYKYPLFKK